MAGEFLLVMNTCPDRDSAGRLATALVEQGLAACVNILAGARSVYRWKGRTETAEEHLLLIKTDRGHYAAVERAIRAGHPYELPEVIAVPVADGSAEYLVWLEANLCKL